MSKNYLLLQLQFLPNTNYLTCAVTHFVCRHCFCIIIQRHVNAKLHFCTRRFKFQSPCFSSILSNGSDGWTGLCVSSSSTSVRRTRLIMSRRWISSDFMGIALDMLHSKHFNLRESVRIANNLGRVKACPTSPSDAIEKDSYASTRTYRRTQSSCHGTRHFTPVAVSSRGLDSSPCRRSPCRHGLPQVLSLVFFCSGTFTISIRVRLPAARDVKESRWVSCSKGSKAKQSEKT